MRIPLAIGRSVLCAALATSLLSAQERTGLVDAAQIARARAKRQRPEQVEALKPFLPELELEYYRNQEVLDGTIESVAKLGDSLIPLLLEYLRPEEITKTTERLAANSRRVLAFLDPRSFVDSLVELADSEHVVARRQAMVLLGLADHPTAARAIRRNYGRLSEARDQQAALRSSRQLMDPEMADEATRALITSDPALRGEALEFLRALEVDAARPKVLEALSREAENALLPEYVRYLTAVSKEDKDVADALIPLLTGVRLDTEGVLLLVGGLATIAPRNHKPTRDVLMKFLQDNGESGRLGVACAKTLSVLGDRRGEKALFATLDERVKRSRQKADALADRADAHFAFGRLRDAIRDFEKAARSAGTPSREAIYQLQIARCEAHRGSAKNVARAIRDAKVSAETVRKEAAKDPVFAAILDDTAVVRVLENLR